MNISQEQYQRMIDYFEGNLSAEKEVAFLKEVSANEEFRKEFDWELVLRTARLPQMDDINDRLDSTSADSAFEPADRHIKRVKRIWEREDSNRSRGETTVVRMKPFLRVAVVCILVLGAAFAFILLNREKRGHVVHAGTPAHHDSVPLKVENREVHSMDDSLLAANNAREKRAYHQLYHKYTATGEDPVQVSRFLIAYNEGDYRAVLAGTPDDLSSKGADADANLLKCYLDFYQGLSYLQLNKSEQAIEKLQEAGRLAARKDQLYYSIRWYEAMAFLQNHNQEKAKAVLFEISRNKYNAGYRQKSSGALKLLNE